MGPQAEGLRVVLDTNAVVSALAFERGAMVWLRHAWQQHLYTPLIDTQSAGELVRVLSYPKLTLDEQKIRDLLSDYLPYAEVVKPRGSRRASLPACRDPDDQKFLDLAARGNAHVLVTGDKALLELTGKVRFEIETPASFRKRFTT
ncbi:MAG: putative toxin-antitoxin system toxin component, PIN family [Betaproteobacteria bacterium]|nr:putative toxin-antitoxin system toxin component, PIN family [Betaproteobacteria bacterium]